MKTLMKNHLYPWTLIFGLGLLGGCGHGHLTKGKLVNPLNNELVKLETDKSNKGKRVSVAGYPAFTGDIKAGMNDDPVISVYTEPDGKGRLVSSFPVRYGKSANEVHVPKAFTNRDIVLYDNEGKSHPYNERMQFSFTLDMQLDRPRITNYLLDDKGIPLLRQGQLVYPTYLKDIRIDKIN